MRSYIYAVYSQIHCQLKIVNNGACSKILNKITQSVSNYARDDNKIVLQNRAEYNLFCMCYDETSSNGNLGIYF